MELIIKQHKTTKFSFSILKELDNETQYTYFVERYYDSNISIWLSASVERSRNVDPLAQERPWLSPYNYCQWNPVGRVDPTGALDGWVEDEANPDKGVYWDPNINSQAQADAAGVKYHGQEGWGYNENTGNRIHYKTDGFSTESLTTLSTHNVYGLKGSGTVTKAMEKSMNQGYDPEWISDFNYMMETIMWAITIEMDIIMLGAWATAVESQSTVGMFSKTTMRKTTALEGAVKNNYGRFVKDMPVNAKGNANWRLLDDGYYLFEATSPATKIPGSKAVYQKWVTSQGETFKMIKTTYATDGSIVHVKPKF